MHMYAEAWEGKVIPTTTPNGQATNDPMPWHCVISYAPNAKDGDKYKPMHMAVLYEERLIEDPEVFYCPAQPRLSLYPIQYDYGFYTQGGRAWGSYIPAAYTGGHQYVRTSYNYWRHKKGKLHELAQYPVVVDNLQEWEVIPHRAGEDRPQGVSALFGDGHVNFCSGSDLFENDIWPRQDGWYNGPGDNKKAFEDLLRIIRVNYQ